MKFRFFALKLCLIMVSVFLVQIVFQDFTEFFVLTKASWGEIWRFVSAIFLHVGLIHLIYNLFALALFGSILESVIGSRRFLIIFFISGILANLVSINFYDFSLGASGAIFGVIGALIIIRPLLLVWAFGLPMPIFFAGILWATGDIIGAYGFFIGQPINNSGNIAHLSGMFFGMIFGILYKNRFRRRTVKRRNNIRINEGFIRNWEDRYF